MGIEIQFGTVFSRKGDPSKKDVIIDVRKKDIFEVAPIMVENGIEGIWHTGSSKFDEINQILNVLTPKEVEKLLDAGAKIVHIEGDISRNKKLILRNSKQKPRIVE